MNQELKFNQIQQLLKKQRLERLALQRNHVNDDHKDEARQTYVYKKTSTTLYKSSTNRRYISYKKSIVTTETIIEDKFSIIERRFKFFCFEIVIKKTKLEFNA